jgi:hypothetical protein
MRDDDLAIRKHARDAGGSDAVVPFASSAVSIMDAGAVGRWL